MQYDDNAEKYGYEGEMETMKCDKLQPLVFSISDLEYVDEPVAQPNFQNPHDHAVYKATEVDAAIAELKEAWRSEHDACESLKQKLEDVQASAYAESVDAGNGKTDSRRKQMTKLKLKVEEVTEPQIFNPPKRLLTWSYNQGDPCNVCEREVVAILPKLPNHANVVCLNGESLWWATHCGIIKEAE